VPASARSSATEARRCTRASSARRARWSQGLRGDAVLPGFIQSALAAALAQPTGYVLGAVKQADTDNPMKFRFEIAPGDSQACLRTVFGGATL
jgi:hypothetical protein